MSGLDLQNCINKHGSIYLNENPWQNVFRISRNLSSFTNPALSGTESQDRQHARHYLERRRGCGESGRIRETDYRGIAPDGKRSFHSWARRQQPKKEAECNAKPEVNRKEKKLCWYTRLGKIEIRRADLHPRSWRTADSNLCGIGASGVPWVFGSPAASHDRFWCQ